MRRMRWKRFRRHFGWVARVAGTLAVVGTGVALIFGAAVSMNAGKVQTTSYGVLAIPDSVTPDLIALGDDVFHGRAAAVMCSNCHGQRGTGTRIAPNLADRHWARGDGSRQSIEHTIRRGIYWPAELLPSMPGFDGALTPVQIRAVAAYVHSLGSRGKTPN